MYSRVGLPSLAVRVSVRPALRSPRVASAAWNKGAPSLLLLVGLAAAGGGSGSWVSNRVDCSGGGHLDVDFVLVPRRRGDAGSGVVMGILSLYRSEVLAACAGGGCCRCWPSPVLKVLPGSSLFIVVGEDGVVLPPVSSRSAGAPACWYGETEAYDFPSATSPSSFNKVGPAPGGSGDGGAAARPGPAPLFLLDQARDFVVISVYGRFLCNTGYLM